VRFMHETLSSAGRTAPLCVVVIHIHGARRPP
jgi:hypothetical protein